MVIFYDIDGTLIDSDSRFKAACFDGVFNVAYYRERQTVAELQKDKPLPLLHVMRDKITSGYILTAREMLPADFGQMDYFGINPIDIFHRGNAPDYIAKIQDNGEYKKAYIKWLRLTRFYTAEPNQYMWARIYDDDIGVLKMARSIGVIPHNAVIINELLARDNDQKIA